MTDRITEASLKHRLWEALRFAASHSVITAAEETAISAAFAALQHPQADLPVGKEGWRPITEADSSIATVQTFGEVTLRNSHPVWVRDADGRVYEAVWTDHKQGYWWDIEGESPVDPVEYYPHPLAASPSTGGRR